jgi:predicted nucleic acid-binding protein
MIFLDTSAIYALASQSDVNHTTAKRKFASILDANVPVITHNYVLVEATALLQHRLGLQSAVHFEREREWFAVEWITPEMHAEAVMLWSGGRRSLSFVDQVSILLMQRRGIDAAFAFDPDLAVGGIRLY